MNTITTAARDRGREGPTAGGLEPFLATPRPDYAFRVLLRDHAQPRLAIQPIVHR